MKEKKPRARSPNDNERHRMGVINRPQEEACEFVPGCGSEHLHPKQSVGKRAQDTIGTASKPTKKLKKGPTIVNDLTPMLSSLKGVCASIPALLLRVLILKCHRRIATNCCGEQICRRIFRSPPSVNTYCQQA